MRNPVGPLPSSIYWRRRVVALCLLAVAALIAIWLLNSRGGGGGQDSGAPAGSHTPVASITPGPDPSGTHFSGRPGGRDTEPGDDGAANGGAGDGGSTGTADTAGSSGSSGTAGSTPSGDPSDGAGTGTSSGTSVGGAAGTPTPARPVPADASLPTCAPGSVTLSLASAKNSYSPGDTPTFLLRATNAGGVTCKVDFGPKSAVFTVTKAADSGHVWASNDCPATGANLLQVPAHGSTTYTLRWDGKTSSPQCGKPKGQQTAPGTYLIQAQLPGYPAKQLSFYVAAD